MKLKKCPFCGAEAEFTSTKEEYDELVEKHGSACLRIVCTNDDCGGNLFVHSIGEVLSYEEMVELGCKLWNRRAEDA